jgi:hypothetical protein
MDCRHEFHKNDATVFDSTAEYNYFLKLQKRVHCGEIDRFERQVKFELVPKQEGERAVNYVADFITYKGDQRLAVIDVKGMRLPDYIIKRKLMLHVHGIRVVEA